MRRNVSSSGLVSVLHGWALADRDASRQDWAEQLSQWFGPLDAITLHAAHQSIRRATAVAPTAHLREKPGLALEAEFRRLRTDLVKFCGASFRTGDADYAPFRQRYGELQRRMDWRIDPFRAHCRQVLSQASGRLKQLVELDIAMADILGEREKALLSKLPVLLERRFEQRRKSLEEGWLDHFEKDFQDLAAVELSFRLEPIVGLIEAMNNEA